MSFFQYIKNHLTTNRIRNLQKKVPRKKEFHNLESAKSIGIVFDTLEEKNLSIVKKFANDLSKKTYKVQTIGWINSNELTDYDLDKTILLYTNKDVKWSGEPIKKELADFLDCKFDLLFILTESNHHSIKHLTNLSKAACKIGSKSKNYEHLDLIIDQGDNKSIEKLISESLKYLTIIKK